MEEVWNDLNLVPLSEGLSLHNTINNNNPPNQSSTFGVHDFLGRSMNRDPQYSSRNGDASRSFFGSHNNNQMQPPPPPPLGPVLNLNSSPPPPGLELLADNFDPLVMSSNSSDHHQTMMIQQQNPMIMSSVRVPPQDHDQDQDHHGRVLLNNNDTSCPFQALASATRLTSFGRKRLHENAYTNELELELSHLLAENAKLKKQHEQFCLVVDAPVATSGLLQRASTAPF
ncbi:hypothetical protein JRO89_XS08G0121700 [Xanthoceras sorbifolium]|uniref:Uncharacterized protein n=1 Tax=Xanthoceras sorbifolium TaxID=99658 RepID=A0ABQ8HPF8_9ROSI|nr:hypothetical protein JRO89_XS08G0121700 [Xanthoceras sorbifolium]